MWRQIRGGDLACQLRNPTTSTRNPVSDNERQWTDEMRSA